MAKLDLQADSVEQLTKGINPPKKVKVEAVAMDDVKKLGAEDKASEEKGTLTTGAPVKRGPGRPKKRKIDMMPEADAIRLHVQRNTHSVQKASDLAKKEIYSSEHVFVEDGDEAFVETDSTHRKEEWLELVASSKEDRILKGTITSITEISSTMDPDDPEYIPDFMAKVRFKTGQFTVNIPSYVLYHYHYERMNKAMAMDIQKNMMRRLGAEIDFVVRYCDEATGTVYGDRLSALSMRGVRNYTSINGRKPNIIPGMIVQAKIIAVAREYITVDAAGAEIRIPIEEISWLYMADAREFDGIKTSECYRVGSRVNVKILSAEPKRVKVFNSSYTLIEATGSIKQAKANPRLKYFAEFNPGDFYAGIITGITEAGVFVNLDNKMDCVCKHPTSGRRMPIMGEQVVVRINSKDEDKKFIYGSLK
ncbi:MAG: S1 RNA-binding domain-containing protein [Butyrivibrio sp.]|nr:S1 RNA-binding domain-containing protein [Butyrivibrio sp.]